MNWTENVTPSRTRRPRFSVTIAHIIGWLSFVCIFSLVGCLQDSPSSDKEHTVSLLLELLHDTQPEMRRTAAESLGKIGDPQGTDSILLLIHDPASIVREAAVKTAGRVKPAATEALTLLLAQALEDPSEAVRRAAVVAIGDIEPSSRLLEPVLRLRHAVDPATRRSAALALLQTDSSPWISMLIATEQDTDATVRQAVVAAVGEWGGEAASPWIEKRLILDSSPGVRAEAAYRLSMRNTASAKSARNVAAEHDPDREVRLWARQRD